MSQITSPGGIGSYTQWRQANSAAQEACRPYMSCAQVPKVYQEIGGVYVGGGHYVGREVE